MPGPLDGIKVIDCTQFLAGPMCTQILGDMGAEIIKVENTTGGDRARYAPLFFQSTEDPSALQKALESMGSKQPLYFLALNRNKRSICIDLKAPEGKEVFYRIAKTADVVVSNFLPGAIKRLGLDRETLQKINKRIICCNISAFGARGPDSQKGGTDLLAQARSGLITLQGRPGQPTAVGFAPCDDTAGLLAAYGITLALLARERTGEGQEVHTSLLAAGLYHQPYELCKYLNTGALTGPSGRGNWFILPPFGTYLDSEGKEFVVTSQWAELCYVLGLHEVAEDERFKSPEQRLANRQEAEMILQNEFSKRTREEWLKLFEENGISAAAVATAPEVENDPQVIANDLIIELDHPLTGKARVVGIPLELSATPGSVRRPAPLLGEHTREILAEYGYSSEEIEALYAKKVVAGGVTPPAVSGLSE